MARVSDQHLLRLWRASVPLSQAWLKFARPADREHWQQLKNESAIDAFSQTIEELSKSDEDSHTKIAKLFAGPSRILTERGVLADKLKSDILDYIRNGHLHGFAFEKPRTLNAIPVSLPKRAWSGKIDWDKSQLTFESIDLVEVRLTTNRIRNEILERGTVDMSSGRAPGRPGIGQAISQAFDALNKAGEIDTSIAMIQHYPKVRKWLELNHPDLPRPPAQLSDEGIREYFSPKFKALKKTRKQ